MEEKRPYLSDKLKLELFKLKGVAPRRRSWGIVTYNDVIWFLLKYHKEKEGLK